MKNGAFFADLTATLAAPLFEKTVYPWEVLPLIKEFILSIGPTLDPEVYEKRDESIWIAKDAVLFPNCYIGGPTIIGPGTEVRPGAFIRGSALVGSGCVVGNSTELKNCILFDHVQVPHYNYVGDSILGAYAHMGAGSICSNVKADKSLVIVHTDENTDIPTGIKKFGAILGDRADIGCNSVLCPGTCIKPGTTVYPLSRVRGTIPAGHIFKDSEHIVPRI